MSEKKIIIYVFAIIALIGIVCGSYIVNSYNNNKPFVPSMSALEALSEDNVIETKEYYNADNRKEEFVKTLNKLLNTVSNMLLDGSVSDPASLASAVSKYNKILSSDDWTSFGLEYPKVWLGKWYLNENGLLKFRFLSKEVEPIWVKDSEVSEYIVLN